MKREFVTIRWSDFPVNRWVKITIVKPGDYSIKYVCKQLYIVYKGYFPFIKAHKLFNLVLPYKKFDRALRAIPKDERQRLDGMFEFELLKTESRQIHIRNWRQIRFHIH